MTDSTDTPSVQNNTASHRFELQVDGGTAFVSYDMRDNEIVFTHTEVPPESRDQGVGQRLAQAALAYARQNGLTIVPQCPFIAAYMRDHVGA